MAYTHDKHDYVVGGPSGIWSDGFLASGLASWKGVGFNPGYTPHIVRAVSLIVSGMGATGRVSGTVKFLRQNVSGAPGSLTTIAVLSPTSGTVFLGKVAYRDGLSTEISPGQRLRVKLSTASTVGGARYLAVAHTEPRWEVPGNDTDLVKVTS